MTENSKSFLDLHPFVRQVVADKIRGAIIGSALGDCIGLYTEFLNKSMSLEAYPDKKFRLTGNVTQFRNDSHRNKFTEGSWTDDTDHCLLIILSFLHSDGETLSSLDFAKRLRLWIEQGLLCLDRLPLGVGQLVGSVVTRSNYLEDPKASAYQSWANSSFHSAPNGSLMRTYPLGIMCMDKSLDTTFDIAKDFSLVTHADTRCVVSCCIATAIIRGLLTSDIQTEEDIDSLVEKAAGYVEKASAPPVSATPDETQSGSDDTPLSTSPPPLDRQELYLHTKASSYSALEIDDLRKLGFVYKCLGSSILCLRLAMRWRIAESEAHSTVILSHTIFEDLITDLVLEGGDADTNSTVAGAFLGCYLGFSALPPHWYEGMQNSDWLLTKSDALIHILGIDKCAKGYVGSEDTDTRIDGGRPILDKAQLERRTNEFMEVYLKKSLLDKKGVTGQGARTGNGTQEWKKMWKNVFG